MANKFKKALDTRSVKLEKVAKKAENSEIQNENELEKSSLENETKENNSMEINNNDMDMNCEEQIVDESIENENETNKIKKNRTSKKVGKKKNIGNDKIPEILAELGIEGKKEYKNKTYYLSVKVIEEISRIAKVKGMSESKLINDLLEKILC